MAQEGADEEVIEEIVTTGIRSSLMTSMNRKRTATGVVDAITAEEIGKFPDQNLAEALARITGVSIQRTNNEGTQITVRGMGPEFNLVTLNGRSMPTQGGRSFDFGDIATEGVRAVEVYKSGRVDIPSGGIGATVNIETARPLDSPGFRSVVSAKAVHETTSSDSTIGGLNEFTPELAALVSSTFADDTIGVLLTASYQDRDNREEFADVDSWIPNYADGLNGGIVNDNNQRTDGVWWHPQNIGYGFAEISRERTNAQLVLQWAPTDRITTTLDYTYSEVDFEKNGNSFGLWFQNPNVESTINERGTITEVAMDGGDYAVNVNRDHTIKENDSLGLNIDWQVTDTLSLNLDVHDSSSTLKGAGLGDGVPGSSSNLIIGNTSCNWCGFVPGAGPFTGDIETKSAVYPASGIPLWDVTFREADSGAPLDDLRPSDIGSLFGQSFDVDNKNDITQIQLAATWDNDTGGAITSIDFGVGYTDQEFVNRDALSGLLPAGFWNESAAHWPDETFQLVNFGGLLSDFSNAGNFAYDNYYTADFGTIVDIYETAIGFDQGLRDCCYWTATSTFWGPDFVEPDGSRGFFNPGPLGNGSGAGIQEKVAAAYAQVNFEDDFNGLPINGSFGVRYEDTETISTGDEVQVTAVVWTGGDEFASEFSDPVFVSREGSNKVWLPSLNINMEVAEDMIARFGYSRTLARPPIGDLSPIISFTPNPKVDNRLATRGNPNLVPYLSDNLDLSFEWYYGEGSYASVTHFRKRVDNFLVSTTTQGVTFEDLGLDVGDPDAGAQAELARQQLTDEGLVPENEAVFARINENIGAPLGTPVRAEPGDPPVEWSVTQTTNARVGNLWGWEFQVQHMWDMGFGIQANLTTVSGDVDADRDVFGEQFALPGLSDSANLVAFYENDWIGARVAWNWRDEYLLTFDRFQAPVYFEEYQQVDINVTWYATERLDVFFEALNVTQETIRQYVRYEEQYDFGAQYGARYNIGARYTFD
jgi:TonB-dependent receptor